MVTLFTILDIYCELMSNLFMFLFCEITSLLLAITNRMSNKIQLRVLWKDRGDGKVRGSAGGHGPKKVEER